MSAKSSFETELLYFSHGFSTGTEMHSHAYFQLEYCIRGELNAAAGKKNFVLNAGDLWLIPPNTMHSFKRLNGEQNFISLKFSSPFVSGTVLTREPICQYYAKEMRKIIDGEGAFNAYSAEGKCVLENLLSGLLRSIVHAPGTNSTSKFETEMQSVICRHGAAVSVNDLAEHFGMTRPEFKYSFAKETGSTGIKEYIDRQLLKMAEQHLRYSDMPLSRIASQLQFSSIYAFSRYYKHHRGITPSEYRSQKKL